MRNDRATWLLVEALMDDATKRRISKKQKLGLCIRKNCTRPYKAGCRGNCKECYDAFDYERRLHDDRQQFDRSETHKGNVLPSRRGRKKGKKNPYRVVA